VQQIGQFRVRHATGGYLIAKSIEDFVERAGTLEVTRDEGTDVMLAVEAGGAGLLLEERDEVVGERDWDGDAHGLEPLSVIGELGWREGVSAASGSDEPGLWFADGRFGSRRSSP
jgi:hypothetical protein